jgi:hypothetical protein
MALEEVGGAVGSGGLPGPDAVGGGLEAGMVVGGGLEVGAEGLDWKASRTSMQNVRSWSHSRLVEEGESHHPGRPGRPLLDPALSLRCRLSYPPFSCSGYASCILF